MTSSVKIKMSPNPQKFNSAEFRRNEWFAAPEAGTTLEQILDPDFWSHVSGRVKPLDIIEVLPEDASFYARLMVTSCSRIHAKVVVLYHKSLVDAGVAEPTPDDAGQYEVKWLGPSGKFGVLRTKDKHTVKSGFSTKPEAEIYLQDYVKALES